jgi:hypothetical protein
MHGGSALIHGAGVAGGLWATPEDIGYLGVPNSERCRYWLHVFERASFLATVSHGVVKIGGDVGAVSNFGSKPKPKMTTI